VSYHVLAWIFLKNLELMGENYHSLVTMQ